MLEPFAGRVLGPERTRECNELGRRARGSGRDLGRPARPRERLRDLPRAPDRAGDDITIGGFERQPVEQRLDTIVR